MGDPSPAAGQARLTIDLDALVHNHAALCAEAAGAEVAPVLKSDAYGLGAGPIARRLWGEGARSFFVARLAEGETLRAALTPERPATIYVLDGMTQGAGPRLDAADLTPALCSLAQIATAGEHAIAMINLYVISETSFKVTSTEIRHASNACGQHLSTFW